MTYAGMHCEDDWPADPVEFGKLLRDIRELAGLSRQELADRAGISWHTLRNIEQGLHATSPDKRTRLIAALSAVAEERSPTPEIEAMSLKILGPYLDRNRNRWRLLVLQGSQPSSRYFDSQEDAEAEKARLLEPPPKEESCP